MVPDSRLPWCRFGGSCFVFPGCFGVPQGSGVPCRARDELTAPLGAVPGFGGAGWELGGGVPWGPQGGGDHGPCATAGFWGCREEQGVPSQAGKGGSPNPCSVCGAQWGDLGSSPTSPTPTGGFPQLILGGAAVRGGHSWGSYFGGIPRACPGRAGGKRNQSGAGAAGARQGRARGAAPSPQTPPQKPPQPPPPGSVWGLRDPPIPTPVLPQFPHLLRGVNDPKPP